MRKVLTPQQMRASDAAYGHAHGGTYDLMENAGAAVARTALRIAGGVYGTRVTIVCGKGNNGGDGFVAARIIKQAGAFPVVVTLTDPAELKGDARTAFDRLKRIPVLGVSDLDHQLDRADVVIDAIFGTGFRPPLSVEAEEAIRSIVRSEKPVVSVDIASGVDSSTGSVGSEAVHADITVALAALKPGHLLGEGRGRSGSVEVADIGIEDSDLRSDVAVPEAADVVSALPPRPVDAHKRNVGKVLVVAGSSGMAGAAVLASMAAYRSGAGLVRMAVPHTIAPQIDLAILEALTVGLPATSTGSLASSAADQILELSNSVDAVVLGPGMGREDETSELIRKIVLQLEKPLVLDADGLTPFASEPEALLERKSSTVITPHAGELARLLGSDVEELNADRIVGATQTAARTGCVVLFKGFGTIVAAPDERVAIIDKGGPVLATAGTGDVLSGIVGTLLTRSEPFLAAYAGAWLHGAAGDLLSERTGSRSSTAGDVLNALPEVIARVSKA